MKRNQIRIIAGKWRGRKIIFPSNPALRPTADRIRETLFNWLTPSIQGAHCLDLFSGSGALGFEALSRGAHSVVALEKDPDTAEILKHNCQLLETNAMEILAVDALLWLSQSTSKPFDIVFVDPPYSENLLIRCFKLLEEHDWIHPNSFIYFESPIPLASSTLPMTCQLLKDKKAGQVYYYLAQRNA